MSNRSAMVQKLGLTPVRYVPRLPLLAFLTANGIQAYTMESGTAYMARELERRQTPLLVSKAIEYSCLCVLITAAAAMFAGILLGVASVVMLITELLFVSTNYAAATFGIAALLFVGGLCGIVMLFFGALAFVKEPYWHRWNYNEYRTPMPADILYRAVVVMTACPDAVLTVYELRYRRDPLLVVQLDDEQYVIGVWDEPRFCAEPLI